MDRTMFRSGAAAAAAALLACCLAAPCAPAAEAAEPALSGDEGASPARTADAADGTAAAASDPRASKATYPLKVEKRQIPTLEKEVGEASGKDVRWGAHADAGTAGKLPFRLTGTLPDNYDLWGKYYYAFTDRAGAGLALESQSVRAYWVHDGKSRRIARSKYTVTGNEKGIKVEFADLKKAVPQMRYGDSVRVEYTGHVSARTKRAGQDKGLANTARLEYTVENATGRTARTEPASTESYTYMLRVVKTDRDDSRALAGAKYTLRDAQGRYLAADGTTGASPVELTTNRAGEIDVHGLDAGTYVLTETRAPAGYEADYSNKTIDIDSNAADMADTLELSAKADGGAKVESVSANTGIVSVGVSDARAPDGAGGAGGGTSPGTGGADASGGLFGKTGNPLLDWAWALAAAAAAGAATAAHGVRRRRRDREARE